jgi:hypothetical protein
MWVKYYAITSNELFLVYNPVCVHACVVFHLFFLQNALASLFLYSEVVKQV